MNKELIEKIIDNFEGVDYISTLDIRQILTKHLKDQVIVEKKVLEEMKNVVKKCKDNHIRLNAMQSKEDKIKQLGTEVLRQLESRKYTVKETLGLTDMLYVSINQS